MPLSRLMHFVVSLRLGQACEEQRSECKTVEGKLDHSSKEAGEPDYHVCNSLKATVISLKTMQHLHQRHIAPFPSSVY